MGVGEEHSRDSVAHNLEKKQIAPSIALMRRLQESEHSEYGRAGTCAKNGFARGSSGQLLEHLGCSRCGHRWVG